MEQPYNGSLEANTVGTAVLKSRGLHTEGEWYWIGIGALIGFAILYNIFFTMALAYLQRTVHLLHTVHVANK